MLHLVVTLPAPQPSTDDGPNPDVLAARIQNTLIGRGITESDVRRHVEVSAELGCNAVTVPGSWVPFARDVIAGGPLRLGSIVDFPFGSATTGARVADAASLVEAGVDELDATVNIGLLLSGRATEFAADLAAVVGAAAPVGVKFMLELPLLVPRQRDLVVRIAVDAGAAYLKNASGGAVGIADPATIAYLRRAAPPTVGVKASGGIKTRQQVVELLAAGADLIGTSAGIAIVTGNRDTTDPFTSY